MSTTQVQYTPDEVVERDKALYELIGIELLRGSIGTIEFFDGGTVLLETAS